MNIKQIALLALFASHCFYMNADNPYTYWYEAVSTMKSIDAQGLNFEYLNRDLDFMFGWLNNHARNAFWYQDAQGINLLMYACRYANHQALNVLGQEYQISQSIAQEKDKNGLTALDYCNMNPLCASSPYMSGYCAGTVPDINRSMFAVPDNYITLSKGQSLVVFEKSITLTNVVAMLQAIIQ